MVAEMNGFSIGEILAESDIESVSGGTSILVLGSDLQDARALAIQLLALASPNEEGVLVITTDGYIDDVVNAFVSAGTNGDAADVAIIDCSGKAEHNWELGTDKIMTVESPGNLTDLGMAFIQYEDEHGDSTKGSRILFDSISTLLEHLEEERVFEFIGAFNGRIHASEHLGIWVMDTSEHSDQTVSVFLELFDIVLEVREIDGMTQFRPRDERSDWISLSQA